MSKKNIFSKYNPSAGKISIILIIAFLFLMALIIKKHPDNSFYQFFTKSYSGFLMMLSQLMLKLNTDDIVFDYTQSIIISSGRTIKINEFFYSLNQLAILFMVVLITKSSYKDKLIFFFTGFIVYGIYNSLRIVIHALYPDTLYVKNELFNLLLIPQWIILLWLIAFYWKKNPQIINFLSEKYKIKQGQFKSFAVKLSFAIAAYYLMLIVFYSEDFIVNGQLLAYALLSAGRYFINLLGYDTLLIGRTLRSEQAALYMDDSCVGINLIFLFAVFILLMPGSLKHKIWFIPAGIIFIIIYNITRIVLIFLSLVHNEGEYLLPVEIHDIYTYPVLLFTFFMWVIWINKFAKKDFKNRIQ